MPNLPVGFIHGNSGNLPQEIQEGSFVFTDDTSKLYLDINGKRYDINHQPVKDMEGISQQFYVNIAGLDYGHYIVSGYYSFDNESEVKNAAIPLDIIVTKDESSNDKVATFSSIESGKHIINIITYRNNKIYTFEKQGPEQIWGSF